jgi:group I intron endonuclease
MIFNLKNCPKVAGIYKINFPNNKSYIGLSNNIPRRMCEHLTKNQQVVDKAIKKYFSRNTLEFEILEIIPSDNRQLLLDREFYYIQLYQTNIKEKGYNLNSGGNLYGIYNPQAKFSEDDIQNIYLLLEDNEYPMIKIAEIYECSHRTIEEINKGNRYMHTNINYPIRKEKLSQAGTKNPNAKFDQETIEKIIWDLQNTMLEYRELAKKYNCGASTIGNICRGQSYKQPNLNYPLRKRNAILNYKLKNQ